MRRFFNFLVSGWFKLPAISPLEGFFTRLFFGMILLYSLRGFDHFTNEPHPVGILKFLHFFNPQVTLAWISDPAIFPTYRWIFAGAVLFYISGLALPVVLPVVAVLHIVPFTLYNSQGYTHHGFQIVSLTLLIQACTAIYAAISQGKKAWLFPDGKFRAWLILQAQVIITGGYLCSVVTKMDNSSGMWLANSNYIAMDMVKTQRQSYLNRFEPEFQANEAEAIWYLERPWVSRAVFGSGLFLELLCVFAIGNRLIGLVMGISLIVMHRSIDALMGLTFYYNEYMCLVFLIGIPFALAWLIERIPWKYTRYGLVGGIILAIPASYYFQSEGLRVNDTLPEYLLNVANIVHYWGEWNKENFLNFTLPIFKAIGLCGLGGLVVGGLFQAISKKNDTASAQLT